MRFFRVVISGLGYRAYTGLKTHRTAADTKLITSRRGGKKIQFVLHGIKKCFLVESKDGVPNRWVVP